MSWENKVVWQEGLFLQPHHFQQHDRYVEALIAGVTSAVSPYVWGLRELTLDEDLLKLGKIAVKSCTGLTPDGLTFKIPQTEDHPSALDIPVTVKNSIVYLAVPIRRHGAVEVDMSETPQSASRYRPEEIEITDSMGRDGRVVQMAICKLRLQFALDLDDLADQLVIPIARIIEVRQDKEIILDNAFIPTCTDIRAARPLHGFLHELEGLLSHRAEALAGRLNQEGSAKGVSEISDFLLLISINRALPSVRHLLSVENIHPHVVYQALASLAGELSTFMAAQKLAPQFAPYRHDDLTNSFQPLFQTLRRHLSAVLEQNAVSIPIEARKYGVSVAMISDKRLVTTATFILAAKASVPLESVRRHFPTQAKLGPVEDIRQLVNSALPGIGLRPLPVAPRQVPYHSGVVYFELDNTSSYWKQITTSGGLAVHVSGEFPDLEMELWAIR
nr:type VI secretion system baseplate subunit TssK [uncultured Cohaesibacter sp.]